MVISNLQQLLVLVTLEEHVLAVHEQLDVNFEVSADLLSQLLVDLLLLLTGPQHHFPVLFAESTGNSLSFEKVESLFALVLHHELEPETGVLLDDPVEFVEVLVAE